MFALFSNISGLEPWLHLQEICTLHIMPVGLSSHLPANGTMFFPPISLWDCSLHRHFIYCFKVMNERVAHVKVTRSSLAESIAQEWGQKSAAHTHIVVWYLLQVLLFCVLARGSSFQFDRAYWMTIIFAVSQLFVPKCISDWQSARIMKHITYTFGKRSRHSSSLHISSTYWKS